MLAVAPSRPTPWLGSPRIAAHSRPQTAWRPLVVCSSKEGAHNKGESGIHDPIGWGKRAGAVKGHEAGLEEQRHLQAQALAQQQERSQGAHPGAAGVGNKYEAAEREVLEVEHEKKTPPVPRAEQQDMTASDDEWEHMSRPQKWWMEAKALLYSWLRTGVEPL